MHWRSRPLGWLGSWLSWRPWRAALSRAALRYAEHGWDVFPGAWLDRDRFDCGRMSCPIVSCHPAFDDWELTASHDPKVVARWWRRRPYSVLLATGRAFDVLEVPAGLARRAIRGLGPSVIGGPVAVLPEQRWMFFVRAGGQLESRLATRPDIVLHQVHSWVPAPPTWPAGGPAGGPVWWRLDPRTVGFELADPGYLQSLLVDNVAVPENTLTEPIAPPVAPPPAESIAPPGDRQAATHLPRNSPDRFERTARNRRRRQSGYRVAGGC